MARPFRKNKRTVDLAAGTCRVSRIRRNPPPPPPRKISPSELRSREARVVVVGLLSFGLAICLILFHLVHWTGRDPGERVIKIDARL